MDLILFHCIHESDPFFRNKFHLEDKFDFKGHMNITKVVDVSTFLVSGHNLAPN